MEQQKSLSLWFILQLGAVLGLGCMCFSFFLPTSQLSSQWCTESEEIQKFCLLYPELIQQIITVDESVGQRIYKELLSIFLIDPVQGVPWVVEGFQNMGMLVERLLGRVVLLIFGVIFYVPMSLLLLWYSYNHRQEQKLRFTFSSPFLLRTHLLFCDLGIIILIALLMWPFALNLNVFVAVLGVWLFFLSTLYVSLQKHI